MHTISRLIVIVTLGAALTTCRGCTTQPAPDTMLDLAATQAGVVVFVPRINQLLVGANSFVTGATRRAGAGVLTRVRDGFKRQFGLDPLQPEQLSHLGIDAEGSLLVFTEGDVPEPLIAVRLDDRAVFAQKITALIEKTDGANQVTEKKRDGFATVTVGRPFGDEVIPAFHWAYVGDYVLFTRADGVSAWTAALKRIASTLGRPGTSTLRTDRTYRELSRRVEPGLVSIFVRGSAAEKLATIDPTHLSTGAITAIRMDQKGLDWETFAAVTLPGLAAALRTEPPLSLSDQIQPDAAALLLTRGARPAVLAAIRTHPLFGPLIDRIVAQATKATGLDPEKDVLPLLSGPLAISVHLNNVSDLPTQLRAHRSLGTVLEFLHLAMVAEVQDPTPFRNMLETARTKLGAHGVKIRQRTLKLGNETATIFEPDRPEPRLGWAVLGNHYVYGAGRGRLEETLRLLHGGPSKLGAQLNGSVAGSLAAEPNTSVLVVRLGRLAEAARKITYNPNGNVGVSAILESALVMAETLGDVVVAVNAEEKGIRLRIRERLQ